MSNLTLLHAQNKTHVQTPLLLGSSLSVTNTVNAPISYCAVLGKSVQSMAPMPDAPVEVTGVKDCTVFSGGLNLFDLNQYRQTVSRWSGVWDGDWYEVQNSNSAYFINPPSRIFYNSFPHNQALSVYLFKDCDANLRLMLRNSAGGLLYDSTSTSLVHQARVTVPGDGKIAISIAGCGDKKTVRLRFAASTAEGLTQCPPYDMENSTIPTTLHGIGSVCDKLVSNQTSGVSYIERWFAQRELGATTSIIPWENAGELLGFGLRPVGLAVQAGASMLCNRFSCLPLAQLRSDAEEGMALCDSEQADAPVFLRIHASRLATPDAVGLQAWLAQNPTQVYVPTKTSVRESADLVQLRTHLSSTHLYTDSPLNPVLTARVTRLGNR